MDRNNLVREVTLRIENSKNTIQIKNGRKASGDGKYDWNQVINREETNSKQVITLN